MDLGLILFAIGKAVSNSQSIFFNSLQKERFIGATPLPFRSGLIVIFLNSLTM